MAKAQGLSHAVVHRIWRAHGFLTRLGARFRKSARIWI
jgi:hypothetical protein